MGIKNLLTGESFINILAVELKNSHKSAVTVNDLSIRCFRGRRAYVQGFCLKARWLETCDGFLTPGLNVLKNTVGLAIITRKAMLMAIVFHVLRDRLLPKLFPGAARVCPRLLPKGASALPSKGFLTPGLAVRRNSVNLAELARSAA